MLLPSYLENAVKVYCEAKNIPFVGGSVPERYAREVEAFVLSKLAQDRKHTKKLELEYSRSMSGIVKTMMEGFVESPIEEYLFQALVAHGLDKHCRPQFEIGKKRVDFAFPIARLAVECDGKQYHHTEQQQIEKDQERDKYLARKGWRVLHIEGLAIRRNIDLCIEKINEHLKPFLPKV